MNNTKLKILILLILTTTSLSSLLGQGWEKLFPHSHSPGGAYYLPKIIETEDGGCVILFNDTPSNSTSINTTNRLYRLDNEGNILWERDYSSDNFTSAVIDDFYRGDDGNYIGIVEDWDIGTTVFKIDKNGDLILQNSYLNPSYGNSYGNLKHVFELPNEEILFLGNSTADSTFYIIRDLDGTVSQKLVRIQTHNVAQLHSAIQTLDDNLLVTGKTFADSLLGKTDAFIAKVNYNGDTLWTKKYDFDFSDEGWELLALPDSSFLGLIFSASTNSEFATQLISLDQNGMVAPMGIVTLDNYIGDSEVSFKQTSEGNFVILKNDFINGSSTLKLMLLNSSKEILWTKNFAYNNEAIFSTDIVETKDKGFYIVGNTYPTLDIYLIKTDSLGNSWTNIIKGNIFYDTLNNCTLDPLELPQEGWIVSALKTDSSNIFYGKTDAQGNYEIRTDTGNYIVHSHIPNAYWTACWNDSIISMPNYFDTTIVDYPVLAQHECPIINVDVSTPFLRRCYDNIYYVNYCNEGTVTAENAYIEIEFDEWLTYNSSSLPWSIANGQVYTFNIGNIEVGECGGFQINVTLDCDSTVLGQTHCVTAHSYPDSICLPPNTLWDGSTVSVEGECLGDSIRFTIQNIGVEPMLDPKTYIITEDIILHLNGTFQLDSAEAIEIQFPVDTAYTYRMEAEQSSFHPTSTSPSVTLEGCGIEDPLSLGFVNQYSEDDADPFVSMDCQENIGSYDPNDKRGFPTGIGEDHIIFDHTELEYHIRFQNTGTDTAFLVVIRDTLSPFLDPATVRPGASSHPYTWTLQNNGALKFTFENIMLPDSNSNEAASHGFVKFKIAQRNGNLPGTIINNQAGIYFDFNAPVITNQTTHKILEPEMHSSMDTLYFCNDSLYTQDTTIITQSPRLSWDVMTTTSIILSSPYETTINSIFYTTDTTSNISDTTLIQYLTSIEGCDSIVIINIDYQVSNENIKNPISAIRLFPNPVEDQTSLIIELNEAMDFNFTLRNSLGQEVGQNKFNRKLITGKNTVFVDFGGLSTGLYWLEVKSAKGGKLIKVIKK